MAIEYMMPALSPTMEKGTIARWLVAEGDLVKAGDPIAEIETDKVTMEAEAEEDGRIVRIVVSENSPDVAVGTVIALIASAHDDAQPKLAPARTTPAQPETAVPKPAALREAALVPIVEKATLRDPACGELATPLVRRIAEMRGIALADIAGSGARGKIVKADLGLDPIIAVASVQTKVPAPASIAPPPEGVPVRTDPLSTMRKTIVRRLTESKQTIPHFYLTVRCNLQPLLTLRTELNGALAASDVKLSVNDMLIKAMAIAMTQVPEVNVQFGGEDIHRFERADIAMAVAIDGGLVTPVIRDAGNLSLSAIADASKMLSTKAREGRLAPADYAGGTATISNLGMFGVDEIVPVINPPQALILGVGAAIEQPWNVKGEIALAPVCSATASFDHRVINGADGAKFMQALREIIAHPLLIAAH